MTTQPSVYILMHHPLYLDGRYHGPDIDLGTHLKPLSEKYGVNVVFSGYDHMYKPWKPEHRTYYSVLANSGELRCRNLKASPKMAPGFDTNRSFMVVESGGDKRYFQTVCSLKVKRRSTRSTFTSTRPRISSRSAGRELHRVAA